MSKYIITGHEGLIGSHLKKRLDERGDKCVLAIDKRNGIDINHLDYEDDIEADVLYHFGAFCKINETIKEPHLAFKNNVAGTFNILEFVRRNKIPKVMIASSSRILSPQENPYTASKKFMENMIEAYRQCYGLEAIIIRPSTVYGPHYDRTGRALHNFIVNAIKNEPLIIYGDKNKTLDFTYIDDFIDGIMLSMKDWQWECNKTYNISGGERKVYDAARLVIEEVGSRSKIRFYPEEKAQPQKVKVDTSEIEKLGFKPKYDLERGIKETVRWYKNNPMACINYGK